MFSICDDWDALPETEELIAGLFGAPKKFVATPTALKGAAASPSDTAKKSKTKLKPPKSVEKTKAEKEKRKAKKLKQASGVVVSDSAIGNPQFLAEAAASVTASGSGSVSAQIPTEKPSRSARKRAEQKLAKAEMRKRLPIQPTAAPVTDADSNADTVPSDDDSKTTELVEPIILREKKRKAPEGYLEQAEKRMKGSRFRLLNERLYTSTGEEAMEFFKDDPEAFVEYHDGYREQIASWPDKPIIQIINWLKKQKKHWIVADFGCGEAQLALSIPQKCHSFDLCALNDRVTVCNMADVPLADETVDVAVFCLSLMGSNIVDFLQEARRVLKVGGILKIAEVSSRIENIKQFVHKTERLGFAAQKREAIGLKGNYFTFFELKKTAQSAATGVLPEISLKPCIYKKR